MKKYLKISNYLNKEFCGSHYWEIDETIFQSIYNHELNNFFQQQPGEKLVFELIAQQEYNLKDIHNLENRMIINEQPIPVEFQDAIDELPYNLFFNHE